LASFLGSTYYVCGRVGYEQLVEKRLTNFPLRRDFFMKNYSSNRAQKGKTAYRTPSRWLSGKPERFKSEITKLHKENAKYNSAKRYYEK
jgi:hypothetical protein